jgi:NADH dehydrogenase [ubiquinone] 1 alpha subcomplex assembly factor 6
LSGCHDGGNVIARTASSNPRSGATATLSAVASLVRRHDRDRFQTALFAPAERREALFALYAFNYEIARVRESVSEPMLGQIRLQWWREVIAAAYAGDPPREHQTAQPLTAAIRELGLDRADFDRLLDVRERDLDPEPPPNLAALEDYAEGSSAALVRLALEVLGVREASARAGAQSVGIGYALAGLVRALPFHARAGRCYIPADIAVRVGLDPLDYTAARSSPGLRVAAAELAAAAARHLATARQQTGAVPRSARAAVLPAVIAERYLKRLRRAGYDPYAPQLALPDPLQAWRLLAATLLRRY